MEEPISKTKDALEAVKRQTAKGAEYWMGRDLQEILGYTTWERFEGVIERAMLSCKTSGVDVGNHFRSTANMVPAGSGTQVEKRDYFVDRYACYLIAMNGDSSKPEIASAQTYFAVKTRLHEMQEEGRLLEKRFELRGRVTDAVKALNDTAQEAGVQNYAVFQAAGYRGLYEMDLREIKAVKGLDQKEELFDRCGPTELAANEFRLTQAQEKIKREKIYGQTNLTNAHNEVGREVRAAIEKIGGTMPENLPAEPSLKRLAKEQEKAKLPSPKNS